MTHSWLRTAAETAEDIWDTKRQNTPCPTFSSQLQSNWILYMFIHFSLSSYRFVKLYKGKHLLFDLKCFINIIESIWMQPLSLTQTVSIQAVSICLKIIYFVSKLKNKEQNLFFITTLDFLEKMIKYFHLHHDFLTETITVLINSDQYWEKIDEKKKGDIIQCLCVQLGLICPFIQRNVGIII